MPRAEFIPKSHLLAAVLAAGALAGAASAQAPSAYGDASAAGKPALTLFAAMKEALTQSEEAKLLLEKEVFVKAQKREVWAEAFPTINFTADVGKGNTVIDASMFGGLGGTGGAGATGGPGGVFSFEQARYAYSLDAYQTLFSFGRVTQAVRAAGFQEKAEAFGRRNSRHLLQLQVLDNYYRVVTARAYLGTLESSVKRNRETVAFLESNFRMGSGVRSNVLRSITALKNLEPQRLRAERDAEAARMELNRILGRPVEDPLELDTAVAMEIPVEPRDPNTRPLDSLVEKRPDIQNLTLARKSMETRARYLKMLYLPTLAATGKIGVTAFDVDQVPDLEDNNEWRVGVAINWNIFDGGAKLARAHQTQSQARQLHINEQQQRKTARIQIENSYRDFLAADTALAAAEVAVNAARDAQAMLSEDFRSGKGNITDLLGADEDLRQSEFQVLNARYVKVRSRGALRLALGQGLINEEDK